MKLWLWKKFNYKTTRLKMKVEVLYWKKWKKENFKNCSLITINFQDKFYKIYFHSCQWKTCTLSKINLPMPKLNLLQPSWNKQETWDPFTCHITNWVMKHWVCWLQLLKKIKMLKRLLLCTMIWVCQMVSFWFNLLGLCKIWKNLFWILVLWMRGLCIPFVRLWKWIVFWRNLICITMRLGLMAVKWLLKCWRIKLIWRCLGLARTKLAMEVQENSQLYHMPLWQVSRKYL